MRYIPILLICSLLFSCNFNQSRRTDASPLAKNDTTVDLEKVVQLKLTNATTYRQVLDKLDQGDLSSLDVAGTLFKNCVADTVMRDSIFVVFNDFYNHIVESYLENNESVNAQLGNSTSTETINQLKSKLTPYGILLGSSEGTFHLEPQTEYLLRNFGPGLSRAYNEYLTIASKEQQTRFAEDGTILIPADSLISRILTWENFMEQYPGFVSIKIAQDKYAQYLGAFLAGMDNSRVFDPETNHLNDGSKASFEAFVLKNPERKSAEVVKSYLDLLQSTNFNYTDKVDSFLLEKVYH